MNTWCHSISVTFKFWCWVPRESVLWGSSAHKATRTAQNLKVTLIEWLLKLTLLEWHQEFRPVVSSSFLLKYTDRHISYIVFIITFFQKNYLLNIFPPSLSKHVILEKVCYKYILMRLCINDARRRVKSYLSTVKYEGRPTSFYGQDMANCSLMFMMKALKRG